MKAKEIIKVIKETLEQLEDNAVQCLEKKDGTNAKMYMDYTVGIRMVLDNIELNERRSL